MGIPKYEIVTKLITIIIS